MDKLIEEKKAIGGLRRCIRLVRKVPSLQTAVVAIRRALDGYCDDHPSIAPDIIKALRNPTDDYPVCDEMILKAAEVIVKVVGAKTTNSVNNGEVRRGLRRELSPHGEPSHRTLTQNLNDGYLKGACWAFVHNRGTVASTIGTCTNRPC